MNASPKSGSKSVSLSFVQPGGPVGTPSRKAGTRVSSSEPIALIRAVVDQRVTFFDTAEVYGAYTNEALVGTTQRPARTPEVSIQPPRKRTTQGFLP
jgi:aryl-alcohol dehydrogenase-like predicted oxidoreductase